MFNWITLRDAIWTKRKTKKRKVVRCQAGTLPLFHCITFAGIASNAGGESPLRNFNQDLPATVTLAVFAGKTAFFLQCDGSGFNRPLRLSEFFSQPFLRDSRVFFDFLKNCEQIQSAGIALWICSLCTLNCTFRLMINVQKAIFQLMRLAQQQIFKKQLQVFCRCMNTDLPVVVICSDERVAEIP